jgi:hypothetical protein
VDRATGIVATLLDRVDAQRGALLADVAALSPEAQRWRAHPTAWSAVDVLEHLVLAEQLVLGDLQTASDRVAHVPTGGDRVRAGMVWLVLRLGVRVRVPADAMRPTGQYSLEELRTRWEAQHKALRRFATRLDRRGLRRTIFRHPIAGPLNAIQALRLLAAHLGTHQRQLERLRAAWRAHCPV